MISNSKISSIIDDRKIDNYSSISEPYIPSTTTGISGMNWIGPQSVPKGTDFDIDQQNLENFFQKMNKKFTESSTDTNLTLTLDIPGVRHESMKAQVIPATRLITIFGQRFDTQERYSIDHYVEHKWDIETLELSLTCGVLFITAKLNEQYNEIKPLKIKNLD